MYQQIDKDLPFNPSYSEAYSGKVRGTAQWGVFTHRKLNLQTHWEK